MNNGSWLPEEDFKGLGDNFFDDLINHLDFPLEDIETGSGDGDWDAEFQNLVPPSLDVLTSLSSEFTHGSTCKGQRVGVQKPVPVLKQSSSSEVDSSLPDVKVSKLFQSSSPVSVLESANGSVSFQNPNRAQRLALPVKGIRSKRKRPTEPRIRSLLTFASGMSQQFAPDESESETYLSSENSSKKRRKKSKNRAAHSVSYSPEPFNADGTVRKCTHCETTKTPQWREGPSGPKTLCNACGVRFRSGRLVPEYRPASSPTFIPTVHSNSHRKIIEMRRKDGDQFKTGRIYAVRSRA
ncbi:hypothetical protein EUTSA_v10017012mg [Eutrema salsugineum]|uniref:GATA-type domain-containing protein n=1 Tax=Eutrema salsugineum TaxID=72664 RepID=V4M8B9_EUTSA|nr:putative GATA transcription factor 13 [Eutrema salsugineum]ESQ51312.1 hypothetical protein EUTSA_v10017012mg [Eutrema salsugineum]